MHDSMVEYYVLIYVGLQFHFKLTSKEKMALEKLNNFSIFLINFKA